MSKFIVNPALNCVNFSLQIHLAFITQQDLYFQTQMCLAVPVALQFAND
jgi:hypothetical protein